MTNAFTKPATPPAWLAQLERNNKNKAGGVARAIASKGVAVPYMSNRRGVQTMKPVCK